MPKPGDLYVSVTTLFAVVLPGAVLTYFALPLAMPYFDNHMLPALHGEVQNWIAFALASYLCGQAVYVFGSLIVDRLHLLVLLNLESLGKLPSLQWLAGQVAYRLDDYDDPDSRGLTRTAWVRTFVRIVDSNAAAESQRLEADYKFFRSFAVVFALVAIRFLLPPPAVVPAIVSAILAIGSAVLFTTREYDALKTDYRLFLILFDRQPLIPAHKRKERGTQ